MPASFSDLCLVVKRANFGEADRLLTLFGRHHGKFVAVAKGVRRLTSRKAPHLELFSLSKLYFVKGHQLPIVTQAEAVDHFITGNHDLAQSRLAFNLLEVLDRLLVENQAHPEIFDRLGRTLSDLNQESLLDFEIYLLDRLGFGQPHQQDFLTVSSYIESILDRRLASLHKLV